MLPQVDEHLLASARELPARALPTGDGALVVCRLVTTELADTAALLWRAQLGRVLRSHGGGVTTPADPLVLGAFASAAPALDAARDCRTAGTAIAVHWGDCGTGLTGPAVSEALALATSAQAGQLLLSTAARTELLA